MSRKFTDSEIRAYSKNRHEEKILRRRLTKLKEDIGTFHDASTKQKQHLVAESKDIRMTSGGSPVPLGFVFNTDFDISKRMSRPWAYSVMETTYNAAYRDAVIPLPKSKSRPKSEASRRQSTMSTLLTNRSLSSKSRISSLKSQSFVGSNTDTNHQSQEFYNSSHSPECNMLRGFRRAHTDIQVKIDQTHAQDGVCLETDKSVNDTRTSNGQQKHANITTYPEMVLTDRSSDTKQDAVKYDSHQNKENPNMDETNVVETVQSLDTNTSLDRTNSYTPLKEFKQSTKVIVLPPMYKIDSKAYQEAERERLISRSKSRVSFSGITHGVNESHTDRATRRSPPNTESKHQVSDNNINEHDLTKASSSETVQDSIGVSRVEERDLHRSTTIFTLDPETMHDIRIRQVGDVVFKGRKLKNYIKPEERYKLDPLVMKMRQNKMDKLAKESISLLKRVNHENIKVDIAFPRTERKRILTKLVRANNSTNGKKLHDDNGPVIQKRVATFMDSISEYIHQQQLEQEQFYA